MVASYTIDNIGILSMVITVKYACLVCSVFYSYSYSSEKVSVTVSWLLVVEPDQDGLIAPSTISQKHISQRVSGSYPVQKAVELMETAEKLGFGKMVQYETPISKRRGKRFRKQHYSSLPHTAKEILAKFSIATETYEATFTTVTGRAEVLTSASTSNQDTVTDTFSEE